MIDGQRRACLVKVRNALSGTIAPLEAHINIASEYRDFPERGRDFHHHMILIELRISVETCR